MTSDTFWAMLCAAALIALIVNAGCLIYLWRVPPPPNDEAVVSMLSRIAAFDCLPLIYFAGYFVFRLAMEGTGGTRSFALVVIASVGYLMALMALILPSVASAVLTYKRQPTERVVTSDHRRRGS